MPFFEQGSFRNPFEFHKKYDFDKDPVIGPLTQRIEQILENRKINAYGGLIDGKGKPLWFLKSIRALEKARLKHQIDHPGVEIFTHTIHLGFAGRRTYECEFDGEGWTVSKMHKKKKVHTLNANFSEDPLWFFERIQIYPLSERRVRNF